MFHIRTVVLVFLPLAVLSGLGFALAKIEFRWYLWPLLVTSVVLGVGLLASAAFRIKFHGEAKAEKFRAASEPVRGKMAGTSEGVIVPSKMK